MNIIVDRNKVIECISTPLMLIPQGDKYTHLLEYCVSKGKTPAISQQFLTLATHIGLLDQLFLEMLEVYKKDHHIQIWHNGQIILKVA